ncbi:hypothetical protein [Mycobacteroides chelonae]|uniref:hypothetical protein n=1 Tax=Mycobacteroides chelonae TaxID=1774 RepID=UPI0008A8B766|nr:hypothetical protein [Mycobacteroides chelonae]OHU48903.1 hypothetical protein BKG81_15985 [Mycobacteroides chelonae]
MTDDPVFTLGEGGLEPLHVPEGIRHIDSDGAVELVLWRRPNETSLGAALWVPTPEGAEPGIAIHLTREEVAQLKCRVRDLFGNG